MSEPLEEKQLDELAAPCWSHDHPSFDHVSFARSVLHAALTQPAPQGVAEVMALVDAYALAEDGSNREGIEKAIIAIVQERDALKAQCRTSLGVLWTTYWPRNARVPRETP